MEMDIEDRMAFAMTDLLVRNDDPLTVAKRWGVSRWVMEVGVKTTLGVSGVYALICPLTGKLRYVGSSKNIGVRYPKRQGTRRRVHQRDDTEWNTWFDAIYDAGKHLQIRVLEFVPERADLLKREFFWVCWFKNLGLADLNRSLTPQHFGLPRE